MTNRWQFILLILLLMFAGCTEEKEESSTTTETTEPNNSSMNNQEIKANENPAVEKEEFQTPNKVNQELNDEEEELQRRQQEKWELFEKETNEPLPEED